ncbi:BrnA antitoxin family protein [Methyloprofundus sp.]|uniref:BrnA antitoxin family protein n=1 Tax=Methyloprofundus sp. TaxID=2020875 RepID=UPI003D123085
MREEYDFSKGKRAKDIPHLAQLQAEEKGKTRITIMLDNDVIYNFRLKAKQEGLGYQTLINQALKTCSSSAVFDENLLRKVIREELKNIKA